MNSDFPKQLLNHGKRTTTSQLPLKLCKAFHVFWFFVKTRCGAPVASDLKHTIHIVHVNHFCNRHFPVQLPRKMLIKLPPKKTTKLAETKALIGYELGRIAFALAQPKYLQGDFMDPPVTLTATRGPQNDGLEKDGKRYLSLIKHGNLLVSMLDFWGVVMFFIWS